MKRILYFSFAAAAVVLAASCDRNSVAAPDVAGNEIVLFCDGGLGFDAAVQTKATAVTSVPGTLYWGASTGSAGSETSKWAAASASVSGGKIATGKYQTATPTTYNYYVANQSFTVGSSATMTVANNSVDVVAGRASSNSNSPSVALDHIFARTGTLSCSAPSGYEISNISWKIVGKGDIHGTAGTYNITTGAWTAASAKLSSDTALTSSSDLYLIPGTYTVKCTYTLSKGGAGGFSKTYTDCAADVALVKGKVNNITASAKQDDAQGISITVTVTGWGNNDITGINFN